MTDGGAVYKNKAHQLTPFTYTPTSAAPKVIDRVYILYNIMRASACLGYTVFVIEVIAVIMDYKIIINDQFTGMYNYAHVHNIRYTHNIYATSQYIHKYMLHGHIQIMLTFQ